MMDLLSRLYNNVTSSESSKPAVQKKPRRKRKQIITKTGGDSMHKYKIYQVKSHPYYRYALWKKII